MLQNQHNEANLYHFRAPTVIQCLIPDVYRVTVKFNIHEYTI